MFCETRSALAAHAPTHATFAAGLIAALALAVPLQAQAMHGAGSKKKAAKVPSSIARDYPLTLPDQPYNYSRQKLPRSFRGRGIRRFDNMPRNNRVTDRGATLGRVLFYDTRLSKNRKVACASCHIQEHGFADPRPLSVGFAGQKTNRNSMGLANARYHPNGRFFWDERAKTLEDQVLMPIQDKKEMGMTLDAVIQRLKRDPRYGELMTRAFGDDKITSKRISRALAQFVRSIISYRSKFDEGIAKVRSITEPFPNFTKEENEGKAIFLGEKHRRMNCASCHMPRGRGFGRGGPPGRGRGGRGRGGLGRGGGSTALFVTRNASNNGLDAHIGVKDTGIGDRTNEMRDQGTFKTPSLRNIELTGPYMHDGRLATLMDVVNHYDHEIQPHPNLDRRLRGLVSRSPRGRGRGRGGFGRGRGRFGRGRGRRRGVLDDSEKRALVAFLKTLTDHELIKDPKFSDPFRKPAPGKTR